MAHNAAKTLCWAESNSGIDFASDVALVLGRSTTDCGRLCGDTTDPGSGDPGGKINKAAKYKPVIIENAISTDGISNWYRGDDGKCGLGITVYSELADIVDAILESPTALKWSYRPPTGGMAAPYRITDFNYYYHIARLLFPQLREEAEFIIPQLGTDGEQRSAYFLPSYESQDEANYSLALSDIYPSRTTDPSLTSYYLGVVFINRSNGAWCVATGDTPLSSLSTDVYNPITVLGATSAESQSAYSEMLAVPFLSSVKLDAPYNRSTQDTIVGNFVSLDGNQGCTMYFHKNGKYDMELIGTFRWRSADPYVRGTATIKLTSGPTDTDVTLHNVQIDVVKVSDDSDVNGITIQSLALTASTDERAEADVAINIDCSTEDGFDPSSTYRLRLRADETVAPVYSGNIIIV